MTDPRGRRSIRRVLVTSVAALVLASGCGDETSPGEAVPALADRLEQVDQAVEAGDYPGARAQLDRLVAETARANDAGQISDEQADGILEAVEAVLAGLPDAEEGSPPTDSPAESEPPADVGDPDEGEDSGEDEGKDKDKGGKKDKD